MALAIDATATAATHTAGATSLDNSNLTIGSGATGLLVTVIFQAVSVVASGVSITWDNGGTNQAMTKIRDDASANVNGIIHLWGLVNPTSGNKTLHVAWTNSCPAVLTAMSFSGGITTSVATAFSTGATNNALSGSPSLSLSGASGNISACVTDDTTGTSSGLTATGSSAWFSDSVEANLSTRGATAPSTATVSWSGSPASTEWVATGVDIIAAASTRKLFKMYVPILGPVLAR